MGAQISQMRVGRRHRVPVQLPYWFPVSVIALAAQTIYHEPRSCLNDLVVPGYPVQGAQQVWVWDADTLSNKSLRAGDSEHPLVMTE